MRISRLRIENFRSIQHLDMEVPQICALIGPNSAGKSNILFAIQRVLGRDWLRVTDFDEDDVYGRDSARNVGIAVDLEPAIEFYRFAAGPPTTVRTLEFEYTRYKIGPQKGQRRLEQRCLDGKGKPSLALKAAPKKGQSLQFEAVIGVPQDVRDQVPLIYIGTNRLLREHLPGARYSLLRQLFEDINRDFGGSSQVISVPDDDGTRSVTRHEHFRSLMQQVLGVLRTPMFEQLERSIKEHALRQLGFDPATESDKLDLYFSPFESMDFYRTLDLRIRDGGVSISATQMGEGVQNALVLAILQAFEERRKQGAVVLIEEPEMFLHPQMQRSLYRTLRRIGQTNQVIYTTHSPQFVTVPEYGEISLVRKPATGTTVVRSSLPCDAKRREKLVKELDPERGELFFATRLLLVEGDTEKLAFPEYAARLGLDLDRAGATIVEVGGKRNLPEFAQIATSFGIPTGIVYDEDSSDFKGKPDEEKAFNAGLDTLASGDAVRVWRFSKKYEDHLRGAIGEAGYQTLCNNLAAEAGRSKPVQARLIAADASTAIPTPVEEIVTWLAGKSAAD